jgi:CRISPR-associated protein Cmr2
MQAALDIARKMEKRAKKYIHPLTGQKKNAFGIALHTRSGEQRELVIPFLMNQEEQSLPILESLINGISKNYSSTFVYAIGSTILQLAGGNKKTKISILAGEKEEQQEFFDVLFAHLLERSKLENQNADSKKTAQELRQFLLLFSNVGQFIHFLEIINRMAKKHTQRRGGE